LARFRFLTTSRQLKPLPSGRVSLPRSSDFPEVRKCRWPRIGGAETRRQSPR
jgi:hypothetical protein